MLPTTQLAEEEARSRDVVHVREAIALADDHRERLKIRLENVERELGRCTRSSSGRFALVAQKTQLTEALRAVGAQLKLYNSAWSRGSVLVRRYVPTRFDDAYDGNKAPIASTDAHEKFGPTGRCIELAPALPRSVPEPAAEPAAAPPSGMATPYDEIPEGYAPVDNRDFLRHVRKLRRIGHEGPIPRPLTRRPTDT